MNNTTWDINGISLELDLDDAEDLERYENAFKKMKDTSDALSKNITDSAAKKIKDTCNAYRGLINDIFGDGTASRIIEPTCWKLRIHEDVIESFMIFASAQFDQNKARVNAFTAKYKPSGRIALK